MWVPFINERKVRLRQTPKHDGRDCALATFFFHRNGN